MAILFLTSSPTGPLDRSRRVDGFDHTNLFTKKLRKYWKNDSRVLVVTAAPEDTEGSVKMAEYFEGVLARERFSVSCLELLDESREFTREEIQSYDCIILGGGHVPTENAFFHRIYLKQKIRGFKGIIIGISAGSMNCAGITYAWPEEEGEAASPVYSRFIEGLGLTRWNVLPHYQMVKDNTLDGQRLIEDIAFADSCDRKFIVLPDGSYILSAEGAERVFGEAYMISDGEMTQICESGKSVVLARWKRV